jgi:hypothetical protein
MRADLPRLSENEATAGIHKENIHLNPIIYRIKLQANVYVV